MGLLLSRRAWPCCSINLSMVEPIWSRPESIHVGLWTLKYPTISSGVGSWPIIYIYYVLHRRQVEWTKGTLMSRIKANYHCLQHSVEMDETSQYCSINVYHGPPFWTSLLYSNFKYDSYSLCRLWFDSESGSLKSRRHRQSEFLSCFRKYKSLHLSSIVGKDY